MWFYSLVFLVQILCFQKTNGDKTQPNIVVLMADDAGWNDFSFHGQNQIPTPNMDALAYHGTILNRFYTQQSCTPSRSAFLTGNYPIRNGAQGIPIDAGENRFLPKTMPTIAESLKTLGYTTHLIGKWHVGSSRKEYTPNGRGFDTFFGYHNGWIGYFDYTLKTPPAACNFSNVPPSMGNPENLPCLEGYALYENYRPAYEHKGKYATTLFTDKAIEIIKQNESSRNPFFLFVSHLAPHAGKNGDELEIPNEKENNERFSYIKNEQRRQYAGIMRELDLSVGSIIKALQEQNLLKNTIIVLLSDNGPQTEGMYRNTGSPWPFRALKFTPYEGAVRGTAIIYSPLIKRRGEINNDLIHITDLYPTLYAAAGGRMSNLKNIDGINQWYTIKDKRPSARKELLVNIDERDNWGAYIGYKGQYKLVNGSYLNGIYDKYYGDTGRENNQTYSIQEVFNSDVNIAIEKIDNPRKKLTEQFILDSRKKLDVSVLCDENKRIASNNFVCKGLCLFDLFKDPCETTDIASTNQKIVEELKRKLQKYWNGLVPQKAKFIDPTSNPKQCNDTWFFWKEEPPFCPVKITCQQ